MIERIRALLSPPPPPPTGDGFRVLLECGHWRSANESWRPAMVTYSAPYESLCERGDGMQPVVEIFDRAHAIKRTTIPVPSLPS